ncbi:hypothetical protein [Paraflavitalea soli]|nr:hypothetical protein [Paraflavitalea soli]
MTRLLPVLALVFFCAACMKCDPVAKQCELTTGNQPSPAAGMMHYEVSITGTAYVHSITYQGEQGPITLSKPTLPLNIQVPVQQNAPTGMQVQGMATDGAVHIRQAFIMGKDTTEVKDICEG